ncbi:glutamate-gated chloride channel-like [Pollicipes pollicipes]|uniref:glutamate-gated chloride channel-like n=1 Tax=Pollicipes pollicipes TaxID=41117 RepID=UPI00188497DF|nr:glutamate-gated chloride channel-like [Pollicipes pollicipes]
MRSFFRQTAEQNANATACRVQPLYRVTPADYDSSMPPFIKGQPLKVYISLWIASITEINEMRQDFTVDLYFRMWWSDFRILFPVCEDKGFIIIDHAELKFSYYFVQMYLPSILIVLVSFLSFWIPVENVPGRVALGVTSLLTLATQFTTMQRSLPPVSYMKAMDVWMFFCIVVVFLSMVEFTLAYNFKIAVVEPDDKPESPPSPPAKQAQARSPLPPVVDLEPVNLYSRRQPRVIVLEQAGGKPSYLRNLLVRLVKLAKRRKGSVIDNASKIMFPAIFLLFNLTYWMYYLKRKHQHVI